MKIQSLVLLLALSALLSASEVIPFGETAVNAIFKDKKQSVILFTDSDTGAQDIFTAAAEKNAEDRIYTIVDRTSNSDHFKRFAEYLGVNVDATPVLVVLQEAKNKFVAEAEDLTEEGIEAFIARVEAGQVSKLLKSAPIPENDDAAVKTLVGNNYKSLVFGDDKEFLVKIYAPWCGHCKTIAPEYVAAAEALAANPNVVLAELDGTLNEVEGLDISGYPTLFWYGKDKTVAPIQFNGGRDAEGIIAWIRDHTEHAWVEPVVEAAGEDEEEL